jgi:hypothetical protein
MDPVHPIVPGSPIFPPLGPIRRLPPVSSDERQEQERPPGRERRREEPEEEPGDEGPGPHIDIRV